ncbi:MAG TPA: class I SAM-dependent methyltransferase [Polyangiaceae bacterium]|nr:class I SAM-dependent methyltransferase [Polyangiaceae bacterium]
MTTTMAEKAFIRAEVERLGAKRLLEVGAFKGETTTVLCAAAAHHGGHVVVVDPMNWTFEAFANGLGVPAPERLARFLPLLRPLSYERTFWRNLRAAGHEDDVTLFRAPSTDERLIARKHPLLREFDFVFLDGDHTLETAYSDVKHWGSRVRKGGVILMHDVGPRFPGVAKAFRTFARDPRYEATTPRGAGTIGRLEVVR